MDSKLSAFSSTDTNIAFRSSRESVAFRPDEAFLSFLGKTNKRQLGTKVFRKTLSKQKPKTNEYVAGGKLLVEHEIQELFNKGAIKTNKPLSKSVYKQHFIIVSSFQNARSKVKELMKEKDFTVKLELQGRIFQHSTSQEQQEIFPVGREVFRVRIPLFRVGSSTANFYRASKNTNILNVKSAKPSCNIPRRSLDNGETMEEVLLGRDTVIFIVQNLGFVIKENLAWN